MGFYGNLTNVNKMQYSFDKTYANRYEMDKNTEFDGVYVGRYALVEYDAVPLKDSEEITYPKCYQKLDAPVDLPIALYTSNEFEPSSQILYDEEQKNQKNYIGLNDIVRCIRLDEKTNKEYFEYFICSGSYPYPSIDELEKMLPVFEHVTDSLSQIYQQNQSIDNKVYTNGRRGYDSTVWQKTFIDGKEKYINIAELNAVIPTFDVVNDPPTIIPNEPHLDEDSTNLRYVIHTQPQWGLRVKSANPQPGTSEDMDEKKSDVDIAFFDRNHFNKESGKIEPSPNFYPGAIYYNKAGFDKNIRSKEDEILNSISILPTGISGNPYHVHDKTSYEKRPAADIQEISMMLPAIGNMASDIWDLAYGDIKATGSEARNLDINWNSLNGLRMVRENKEGSGFEYNTTQLSNIAGCINSVHDLMGMIIIDDSEGLLDPVSASKGKIYFRQGKYCIKGNRISFDTSNPPITNKYPLRDYVFSLADVAKREKLIAWQKIDNDFYFIDPGNIWFDVNINEKWEIKNNQKILMDFDEEEYQSYKYYNKINNDFICAITPIPDQQYDYFSLELTKFNDVNPDNNQQFYNPAQTNWFYEDELNGQIIYKTIRSESRMRPDKDYYEIQPTEGDSWTVDDDGNIVPGTILDIQNKKKLNLIDINPNIKYYYQNNNDFILADNNELNNKVQYYLLQETLRKTFYQKNKYFIDRPYVNDKLDTEHNYILSTDNVMNKDIAYYDIKFIPMPNTGKLSYMPDKFWYQPDPEREPDLFKIDREPLITEGRKYYHKTPIHVESDPTGTFSRYEEWDISRKNFPEGIVLRYLNEEPAFIELKGFARTINTLNGLIIKINEILGFDDPITRNYNSVQGLMNKLRDIIDNFVLLDSEKPLITNSYGRVQTADVNTNQNLNIFNAYDKQSIEEEAPRSQIIYSLQQEGPFTSYISLTHSLQENFNVSNTYFHDLNDNLAKETFIEVYKPLIDNSGHIVKQGYEIITLPNGYKTFEDSNIIKGQSIAQNLKDTLTFDGDNLINPVVTQGNIVINHLSPDASTSYTPVAPEFPKFGESFNINDYFYDNKGHVFTKDTHTVTIPKISLTDTSATGADVITALSLNDTTGAFTSTRTNVGNLKIAGYLKGSALDAINANDTINTAFGKLEYKIDKSIQDTSSSFSSLKFDDKIAPSQIVLAVAQTNGQISVSKDFLSKVALSGYESNTNAGPIAATQTLGEALGTLQNQITVLDNEINDESAGLVTKFNALDSIVTNETTGLTKKIVDLELIVNNETSGVEALNTKITAQDTGIEARLISLDNSINAEDTGIKKRLENIENSGYLTEADFDGYVKLTETQYQDLLNRISALENPPEEPETPPAE